MAAHFEFADFVDEFAVSFTAHIAAKGHYDTAGDWIPGGTEPKPMDGIILPLSDDDFKREGNGSYTSQDRKIYVIESLPMGTVIEYKGERYTIDGTKPYEDYADVYIYFVKGMVK